MVKSTIDDIKDITLERQIRKLAGVIDKQNEVIGSVGDVDARITAVEDSTANNTVQINSVKEDVSKNTIAIENISNRVTNVEESTEAIPGIQTEIDGINKSLISDVTASFDNPSRTLMISVEREASPSIDATVVIPASSETGQYSAGNGITIDNYQIAVNPEVVALKTDIQSINTEITGITEDITSVNNKNTEQDTAIAGKVAIAQGTENAGKVLGIGEDGNVTPVNAGGSSGGGEVWEEVDIANFPTDWVIGDRIKLTTQYYVDTSGTAGVSSNWSPIMEFYLGDAICYAPLYAVGDWINYVKMQAPSTLNLGSSQPLIDIRAIAFGESNTTIKNYTLTIGTASQNADRIKIWRLKQST